MTNPFNPFNVIDGQVTDEVHVFEADANRADFEVVDVAGAIGSVSEFARRFLDAIPVGPRWFRYRRDGLDYNAIGVEADLSAANRSRAFRRLFGSEGGDGDNPSQFERQAARALPGLSLGGGVAWTDTGESMYHFEFKIETPALLNSALDKWLERIPGVFDVESGSTELLVTESVSGNFEFR